MAQVLSTSITRRSMVAGLALAAAPVALAGADSAYAQAKQTMPEKSLYERLGGVFAIAAVVDHFSAISDMPPTETMLRYNFCSASRGASFSGYFSLRDKNRWHCIRD
jgi:hypothetical protein